MTRHQLVTVVAVILTAVAGLQACQQPPAPQGEPWFETVDPVAPGVLRP